MQTKLGPSLLKISSGSDSEPLSLNQLLLIFLNSVD